MAERTPSMLRTRCSAEAGMFVVCSVELAAGSMTQLSARGFSEMSTNPSVRKPAKYDETKRKSAELKTKAAHMKSHERLNRMYVELVQFKRRVLDLAGL